MNKETLGMTLLKKEDIMIYVALLRGINVGGKNKINMKELKKSFERVGMEKVITYINSGNIIFEHSNLNEAEIIDVLEEVIFEDFSLEIKVLLRNIKDLAIVIDALPDHWENDKETKSDVMFLWEEVDDEKVLDELAIKPEIETILYVPGALLWSVDRTNQTKSGLAKLASKKLYKKMTIRNVNSTRKIYSLMEEMANNK